jgi:predicted RNase H-like HicB family nuclease
MKRTVESRRQVDKRRYHVVLEWDPEEQVWVTFVPALNGLSTFGETREEALAHTQEAIEGYFEAAAKEGIVVPAYDIVPEVVQVEVAVP